MFSTRRDEFLAAAAYGSVVKFEKRNTIVSTKMVLKAAELEHSVLRNARCKQPIMMSSTCVQGYLSLSALLGDLRTRYIWNEALATQSMRGASVPKCSRSLPTHS